MFRRLFALETAALQNNDADQIARHIQPEHRLGDNIAEFARFAASPSCYGMWSSRAAH